MKKTAFIYLLLCLLLLSAGCSSDNSLQQKYGDDAAYFVALRSLQMGDRATAERLFKQSAKKASPLIARRAAEELAAMGNVEDRIRAFKSLYEDFQDEDSLLLLCKELYDNREYAQVIKMTDGIDLVSCNNELAYYRCSSLYIKDSSRFSQDYLQWCTFRSFAKEQHQLSREVEHNPEIVSLRSLLYQKNYLSAIARVRAFCENPSYLHPILMSDYGKIFLYGSTNYAEDAAYLEKLATTAPQDCLFYLYFYAGRLYDRTLDNGDKARMNFLKALGIAPSPESYDNALWYYLTATLKNSPDEALAAANSYRDKWHDPAYFDDFFDALSVRLLAAHSWKAYYSATNILEGYASPESLSKFCYVAARLIGEGFFSPEEEQKEVAIERLLRRALKSGTNIYYKFMAAKLLHLTADELQQELDIFQHDEDFESDPAAEALLLGYADFGFPERIYDEWQLHRDRLSLSCVEKIATFLRNCAANNEHYYTQSIRIAARKFNKSEIAVPETLKRLAFPQDYTDEVRENCNTYSEEEYVLYSLIRTESLFDPTAVSSAGATGLTQLMQATAGDVAKKLKASSFDLKDAATNIKFGAFYLDEMIRRLDGSVILAIFAYNGGISRVRTQLKAAELDYRENLPKDVFLELLPISETREYGRRVLAGAVMYGMLYYGLPAEEIIESIMR